MSKKETSQPEQSDQEQPFVSHLIELRDRLLRVVMVVGAIFLGLFYFAEDLYEILSAPLMVYLSGPMIATEVASPFFTPIKLTLIVSIFIAVPYILYQLWGFVAPGLYRHERSLAAPLIISSTLLFYLGMAFAYYVVFPLAFGFLTAAAPEGVQVMTDIAKYLDFVLKLFFAFGIAFEVPVAVIILVIMGVTTPDALTAKRPYVIVGAFVVGMVLTPPDAISQLLLAIPMWLLFELGVVLSRVMLRRRAAAAEAEAAEPSDEELDQEFERAMAEEDQLRGEQDEPEPPRDPKP